MKLKTINFPDELVRSIRAGKLVVFSGAGVSMGKPAELPSFSMLTEKVSAGSGLVKEKHEPEDRFLGRLHQKGVDVHKRAVKHIKLPPDSFTSLHYNLLRLFDSVDHIKIVTTNFDKLFEDAAANLFEKPIEIYKAPALPLGHDFFGLVHVHGCIDHLKGMVLTDADFGRAYLTEGWARRFLVDLFRSYTVFFVGYSHDDVVMHYLARALPESETGLRFALIDQSVNPDLWLARGIEPITFEKQDKTDFSLLNEGIKDLADYVSRSILDWKRELVAQASGMPPSDQESEDRILDSLEEPNTTRFFTQAAKEPAWLPWLDVRNKFSALFSDVAIQEVDEIIGKWLVQDFALQHTDEFILIVSKHEMHFHPWFWGTLAHEITINQEIEVNNISVSKLISVLLYTLPKAPDEHLLLWLGEWSAKNEEINSLLLIFSAMASNRLKLKKGLSFNDSENTKEINFEVELPLTSDHSNLNELYTKHIAPILDKIAIHLLKIAVWHLEHLHNSMISWGKADRNGDSFSYHRSAIEIHDQDKLPHSFDTLIDAARDSLLAINKNDSIQAEWWLNILIGSKTPILRRLSIHLLDEKEDISAEEKLEKFLEQCDLHDISAHHEIFRFIGNVYPELGNKSRLKLIDKIKSYFYPIPESKDIKESNAYEHYNWFFWLTKADPSCELAKQALSSIIEDYPDFQPRKYPDLTHWSSGAEWVGPRSPWTKEELLSKKASEWVSNLLSFKGEKFWGPDRDGLIISITEVTKENLLWSFDLATELKNHNTWSTDLWRGLIRGWGEWSRDDKECLTILTWLNRKELWNSHLYSIIQALYSLVSDSAKDCASTVLSEANNLATALWSKIIEDDNYPEKSEDWLQLAINRSPGVLAEFWLGSVSHWRKHKYPKPEALSDKYRDALDQIIQTKSAASGISLTVLASQLAFFLSIDYEWTRRTLLPWFDLENDAKRFQQCWHGFLAWGSLNPNVFTELGPYFEKAIRRIGHELSHVRDRFVEFYAVLVVFYVTNPLEKWIPLLFQHGEIQDRCNMAYSIENMLRGATNEQQKDVWNKWLKEYWENRLLGIPQPLDPKEIKVMLEWLPRLVLVFSDAVEIAIQMPKVKFDYSSVVFDLRKSELVEDHSLSITKLLIYLLKCETLSYFWHGLDNIYKRINFDNVRPELATELDELLESQGLKLQ